MSDKITKILAALKAGDWHGDIEDDDDVTHIYAERGTETIDIWFEGDRLMMPAEYTYGKKTEEIKTTVAIRHKVSEPPEVAPGIRKEALPFTADDDDATILDAIMGRKVYCASLIYPDFPLSEHVIEPDRLNPPRVNRIDEGRVNVDYLSPTGFRSLRVNNIVKVR